MSGLLDLIMSDVEVYSAGGHVVVYCPRCRTQVARLPGRSSLPCVIAASHHSCEESSAALAELMMRRGCRV